MIKDKEEGYTNMHSLHKEEGYTNMHSLHKEEGYTNTDCFSVNDKEEGYVYTSRNSLSVSNRSSWLIYLKGD